MKILVKVFYSLLNTIFLRLSLFSRSMILNKLDPLVKWDLLGKCRKQKWRRFLEKLPFWQKEKLSLWSMLQPIYEQIKGTHLGAVCDNYLTIFLSYFNPQSSFISLKSFQRTLFLELKSDNKCPKCDWCPFVESGLITKQFPFSRWGIFWSLLNIKKLSMVLMNAFNKLFHRVISS